MDSVSLLSRLKNENENWLNQFFVKKKVAILLVGGTPQVEGEGFSNPRVAEFISQTCQFVCFLHSVTDLPTAKSPVSSLCYFNTPLPFLLVENTFTFIL